MPTWWRSGGSRRGWTPSGCRGAPTRPPTPSSAAAGCPTSSGRSSCCSCGTPTRCRTCAPPSTLPAIAAAAEAGLFGDEDAEALTNGWLSGHPHPQRDHAGAGQGRGSDPAAGPASWPRWPGRCGYPDGGDPGEFVDDYRRTDPARPPGGGPGLRQRLTAGRPGSAIMAAVPTWIWIVIAVVVVLALALGFGLSRARGSPHLADRSAAAAGSKADRGGEAQGRLQGRRVDLVLRRHGAATARSAGADAHPTPRAGDRNRRSPGGAGRRVPERDRGDGRAPAVGDDASVPRRRRRAAGHRSRCPLPRPTGGHRARHRADLATPNPTAPSTSSPIERGADRRGADPTDVRRSSPGRGRRRRSAEPGAAEEIAPTAGRLSRLRGRLARSQNAFGRSLLGLLGAGTLDEDSWTEVEDTLLMADLGARRGRRDHREAAGRGRRPGRHRRRVGPRALLRRVLVEAVDPTWTARSARCRTTAGRRCCWSSASTAPARPPPPASWPGCWWPTAGTWCSAPPTPSGPPPPTSWPPGASGSAPQVVRSAPGRRPGGGRVRRGQARASPRAPTRC